MAAILRIVKTPEDQTIKATVNLMGKEAPPPATPMQSYMDRLVKLIPGEVVGIYMVGNGVIPSDQKIATVAWFIICFLLVIFVRAYATGDKANKIPPQWMAVFVSTVSFVIWAYNMPGLFQQYNLAIPFIGSLAVLLWTFLVPFFYQGSQA